MEKHSESLAPDVLADAVIESLQTDLGRRKFNPESQRDLLSMARLARMVGIEVVARQELEIPSEDKPLTDAEIADWIRIKVSPHPARFEEMAETCRMMEGWMLVKDSDNLRTCGSAWGRIVRLFWRDRKGRERIKHLGFHSCKNRHCPKCGKTRQSRLSSQMERVLELAREWGFGEQHVRFLTLTIPNGQHIPTLRELGHDAWAKLQRTRWWPKNVFGWFRGTEVITGEDGEWNLHIHVVVILWSPFISYSHLWESWGQSVGARCQIDMETLRGYRKEARGNGFVRCARYVTKYISKREDLTELKKGPGGLAHLFASTRRLRCFSSGGGASVLRRMLDVLMPAWAIRAEWSIQDEHLNADGVPPWKVEEVDPTTGEVNDREPLSPFLDRQERASWFTLARKLYRVPKGGVIGTVGIPCGSKKRFRRIGQTPMPGLAPSVQAFRAAHLAAVNRQRSQGLQDPVAFTRLKWVNKRPVPVRVAVRTPRVRRTPMPLEGFRVLVAGGYWKIADWWEEVNVYKQVPRKDKQGEPITRTTKGGKVRPVCDKVPTGAKRIFRRTCVLPARRYSWRAIVPHLWMWILMDKSPQENQRKDAFRAWAAEKIGGMERIDALRAVADGLNDTRCDGEDHWTSDRRKQAEALKDRRLDMWRQFGSSDEFFTSTVGLNAHIDTLSTPSLIWRETPLTRYFREQLALETGF